MADLSLDRHVLAGDRRKEVVKPRHTRTLAQWAQYRYQVSERHALGLLPISRSTLRRNSRRDPEEALRMRLRELAASRVRYGYRRLTLLLKREGCDQQTGAYMDSAQFAKGLDQALLGRLRAYIRPRVEGRHPRALMEFALLLLNRSSASKAQPPIRLGRSRSAPFRHHSTLVQSQGSFLSKRHGGTAHREPAEPR